MKMWKLSGLVLILTIARVAMAQELKKEFVDPQLQEARSTAVKIKGGTLVFLAGHTASQPRPDADLGNFDVQFKAVFEKIGNTLAKAGGNLDDIVSMSVFLTICATRPNFRKWRKRSLRKTFLP